ncbi:MAG: efflux RND transporter periplasmic adaptor subunit [Candidatus Endonucleobacter sp. (ex Gigantidas childressi)]|nr:efflux RND transporter periplasmic adaptor subunit [Candidatus Endonucleobacter sp. (ex Gigantidas childressi)]
MVFILSRKHWLNMISVAALLTAGCDKHSAEVTSPAVKPVKLFLVQGFGKGLLRHFPSKVSASEEAELAFRIPGLLNNFTANEGDDVLKGQILAHLDDRDARNELRDREANYKLSKNEFDRAQSLLKKSVISQAGYDLSKAKLESAKAVLEIAKNNLEYSTLKAPFNGRIAKTAVSNYQQVQAQQVVLVLQGSDMIDVAIQMPGSILAHVNKSSIDQGYKPTVVFPSASEKSYPLTYKGHSTQVTAGTQSYEVVFSLPVPEDLNVLPGMSATVIIDLSKVIKESQRGNYMLVPLSAIASDDSTNKTVVWRFDEQASSVKPVEVLIGRITESGVQIVSGLNLGDKIVSAGISRLTEGMKVKPLRKERGL